MKFFTPVWLNGSDQNTPKYTMIINSIDVHASGSFFCAGGKTDCSTSMRASMDDTCMDDQSSCHHCGYVCVWSLDAIRRSAEGEDDVGQVTPDDSAVMPTDIALGQKKHIQKLIWFKHVAPLAEVVCVSWYPDVNRSLLASLDSKGKLLVWDLTVEDSDGVSSKCSKTPVWSSCDHAMTLVSSFSWCSLLWLSWVTNDGRIELADCSQGTILNEHVHLNANNCSTFEVHCSAMAWHRNCTHLAVFISSPLNRTLEIYGQDGQGEWTIVDGIFRPSDDCSMITLNWISDDLICPNLQQGNQRDGICVFKKATNRIDPNPAVKFTLAHHADLCTVDTCSSSLSESEFLAAGYSDGHILIWERLCVSGINLDWTAEPIINARLISETSGTVTSVRWSADGIDLLIVCRLDNGRTSSLSLVTLTEDDRLGDSSLAPYTERQDVLDFESKTIIESANFPLPHFSIRDWNGNLLTNPGVLLPGFVEPHQTIAKISISKRVLACVTSDHLLYVLDRTTGDMLQSAFALEGTVLTVRAHMWVVMTVMRMTSANSSNMYHCVAWNFEKGKEGLVLKTYIPKNEVKVIKMRLDDKSDVCVVLKLIYSDLMTLCWDQKTTSWLQS